jgi:hypothetical protein
MTRESRLLIIVRCENRTCDLWFAATCHVAPLKTSILLLLKHVLFKTILLKNIVNLLFSEQMEVELQGQDLKSVIEMEDNLLKQKGEVCSFKQTAYFTVTFHIILSRNDLYSNCITSNYRFTLNYFFCCRRSCIFGE